MSVVFSERMSVAPLDPTETAPAFALVRLSAAQCSLEAWEDYLRKWESAALGRRGLLAAKSRRRAILGLMPWWLQPALNGDMLWAGPPWVCEPGARPHVLSALLEACRQKATEARCDRLTFVTVDGLREIETAP
jgi:hypothetical protein